MCLSEIAFYVAAGIISGLLSGALTMGLLPFFESAIWYFVDDAFN